MSSSARMPSESFTESQPISKEVSPARPASRSRCMRFKREVVQPVRRKPSSESPATRSVRAISGEHQGELVPNRAQPSRDTDLKKVGSAILEVHQTQSFPGMEAPAEGPLPGDYDLQLVSDSSPTGLSGKDITLIVAAAIVAASGLGAIVLTIFLGRRRRPQH